MTTSRRTDDRCTSQFIVRDSKPHCIVPAALAASASSNPNATKLHSHPNDELTGSPVNGLQFQPIFEVLADGTRLFAVECISPAPIGTRPSLQPAFEHVARLAPGLRMHVKIDAAAIGHELGLLETMRTLANQFTVDPSRIVIEIIGYSRSLDNASFRNALIRLKSDGFGIAIDDIGSGQSNYRMILDCRPDYLKINRHLIAGIHYDVSQQILVRWIVRLARDFGSRVIAKGVDCGPQFAMARQLGIDLMQGPHLARPRAADAFIQETAV